MPKAQCEGLGTFCSNSLFPAFKKTYSSLEAQKAQPKIFFLFPNKLLEYSKAL